MKLKIVPSWINHPSVCICGHNFGYWPNGGGRQIVGNRYLSFMEVKAEHFKERHPRRWAQGGIA